MSQPVSGAPLHPGTYIRDELAARGMTQTDLARITGYTRPHISRVLSGAYPVGPRFALALERAWGTSAEMWCRLQSDYDVMRARNAAPRPSGRTSR